MSSRDRKDDVGAAAVEMAIVSTLLLTLLAFIVPLGILFYENVQLGRTAGDVVRFASSRAGDERTAGNGSVPTGFLPATAAIEAEVPRVHHGLYPATLDRSVSPRRIPDDACPSKFRRQITVQTTTNLGPLNLLLPESVTTLKATASSCEE